MSLASFTSLLLVANFTLIQNTRYITVFNVLSILLTSIVPYFLFVYASNSMEGSNMQNVVGQAIKSWTFFGTIAVTVGACAFIEHGLWTYKELIKPSVSEKIRQHVLQSPSSSNDDD